MKIVINQILVSLHECDHSKTRLVEIFECQSKVIVQGVWSEITDQEKEQLESMFAKVKDVFEGPSTAEVE